MLLILANKSLIKIIPNLGLRNIHLVIVGGESGPKARTMKKKWVLDIKDQCIEAGATFY